MLRVQIESVRRRGCSRGRSSSGSVRWSCLISFLSRCRFFIGFGLAGSNWLFWLLNLTQFVSMALSLANSCSIKVSDLELGARSDTLIAATLASPGAGYTSRVQCRGVDENHVDYHAMYICILTLCKSTRQRYLFISLWHCL